MTSTAALQQSSTSAQLLNTEKCAHKLFRFQTDMDEAVSTHNPI